MQRIRWCRPALALLAALLGWSPLIAPAARAGAADSWWHPGPSTLRWQWELDHPLRLTNAKDMGTSSLLPEKQPAPAPTVYDIDGIINSGATVAALHRLGDRAICYVEVGSAGNYYSPKEEGISKAYYVQFKSAGVMGKKVSGYPESFLNIKSPKTLGIVESMINTQCAAKGFDAVETDLDETYAGAEGSTGFGLTQQDELDYMASLSTYMHGLGLAWIAKNPDDTGDNYAALIAPEADAVLTEECNQYSTCSALSAFIGVKAVFNAEYSLRPKSFCAADIDRQINGVQFSKSLDGTRHPCQ